MFRIPSEWTSLPKGLKRENFDTIFVGSALRISPATPVTLDFLRHATGKWSKDRVKLCGVFTLAESGVLNGRRVTTHWSFSLELQQR
jgi:transcriptional regulator GlxA family with amidase domain